MARRRGAGVLLAIAVFKLVKAATLIAIGIGALSLARGGHTETSLRQIVSELGFHPYSRHVNRALGSILGIDHRRLQEVGIATFVYAAVFLVEGTGLVLRKRWAEYLTTIVTASFIPFEVYEMIRAASALKAVGILLNALIVVYLAVRLWRERHEGHAGSGASKSELSAAERA
jgi:uncharacterized membrane protein (DUF2068 family)